MATNWSRRTFLATGSGAVAAAAIPSGTAAAATSAAAAPAAAGLAGVEPDIELAKLWWPNPRNVWTPIGWKDHLFRFNVTYNGSVIGAPSPLARKIKEFAADDEHDAKYYKADRLQLDMTPWGGPAFTKSKNAAQPMPDLYPGHFYVYREDQGLYGRGRQSWADHPTPVLQTDWTFSEAGLVLRQSVFAHAFNGADVVTGEESLFAWIRLEVIAADQRLVNPDHDYGFAIRVCRAYYSQELPYNFQDGIVLTGFPELAPFTYTRWTKPLAAGSMTGFSMWQPRGPQLGVLAQNGSPAPVFSQKDAGKTIYNIEAKLKPEVGARIDILQCMRPVNEEREFNPEILLGYDGALADSNRYWSRKPATAATVTTPEKYVNELVARNVQFSEVVASKVPGQNYSTFLTGSMGYDVLWTTPTSMTSHMFLSLLGYHDVVAKHLELYRGTQGTVKPPGPDYYVKHPGYYATPDTVTAIDWLPDHGAVMLAVSTHALMTGDQAFIDTWLPSLLKACDWIKDACALTAHDGVKGLPPAGGASDEGGSVQSIWATAWIYKGLITTIRLLKRLNHARTAELTAFAASYQAKASQALDTIGSQGPKWRHPDGNEYPIYSANFFGAPGVFGEAMRLDAGAMVMVWSGLLPASDPRMVKYCDYFRVGPNAKLWNGGSRKHPLDAPILEHEISSFEPIYSWNIFHSWQLGNRAKFLEGMYSLAAGGVSPQTYIPFEHRGGMSASLGTHATIFTLMRLAVVDDALSESDLNLLRLCPMAWLSTDQDTVFDKMPTVYGPVSLKFRRTGATELTLTWTATWRTKPQRLLVHAPPGFTALIVNGTTYAVPAEGYVVVPA
ncbi:hypothetical protein E1263_00150 [Kribbella antibiotica]|uniref:Tat pathway signal sequence domain protein n=1 Tax=Kribbella antibiotica TaxID=190195 RepID=A0A4R4ZW37_9ACTN|nr:hypothetical protein [Kribbella antibiotica]TDD63401.1 hypothetical protein E1263_00150 [Kribbella antibiotica]